MCNLLFDSSSLPAPSFSFTSKPLELDLHKYIVEASSFPERSTAEINSKVTGATTTGFEHSGNSVFNLVNNQIDKLTTNLTNRMSKGILKSSVSKSSVSVDPVSIPSVQPGSLLKGKGEMGSSVKSDKGLESVRKYKRRQYSQKQKVFKRNKLAALKSEIQAEKVQKSIPKKEIFDQYRYRERLRKIYAALKENEVPSVLVTPCDAECVKYGLTIVEDQISIPPGSTVYKTLVPIDSSEVDDGTYVVEGLGKDSLHSVGDGVMSKRQIPGVQLSNWHFDEPWVICRGDKVAQAREYSWVKLPSMDNVFASEEDFIVNNVRAQFPDEDLDRSDIFGESPPTVGNDSKKKGVGADRLPSAAANEAFLKVLADLQRRAPELVSVLKRVKSMFIPEDPGEPFQFMNVPPVSLKTKQDKPSFISPLYQKSFNAEEKACIDQYIYMNLQNKMIEPAPESPYASPLLVVRKRADPENPNAPVKRRVIIDSRQVNSKCLEQTVFAAPNMDEAVRRLGGGKFHTVVDIKSAFHRLRLAKESRDLTAFIYNGTGEFAGVYRYRNLAQGCQESPRLFVNALRDALGPVFKDMKIAFWIDDGLISSDTYEQHITDVSKFLHAAWKANVKLDILKCLFVQEFVDWCSYRFGNGEVRPSPDRLTCLDGLKYPELKRNKPQSRAYMRIHGLLNYFRRFVPQFSEHCALMKDLIKDAWDPESTVTFEHAQAECDRHMAEIVKEIKTQSLLVVPDGSDLICFTDD